MEEADGWRGEADRGGGAAAGGWVGRNGMKLLQSDGEDDGALIYNPSNIASWRTLMGGCDR